MTARVLPSRRRRLATLVLLVLLLGEVVWGPGGCDPKRGGDGGMHRGVTR